MLPAKTPRSIMSIRTKLLTVAVALLLAGHASERLTLRIGDQR
jgi:sulfonate transport system substrate-binding protein